MAVGDFNSFLSAAAGQAQPTVGGSDATSAPVATMLPDVSQGAFAAQPAPAPYNPNVSAAHNAVGNAIAAIPGAIQGADTNYRVAKLAAGPSMLEWLDNTMFGNDASTAQLKARAAAAPTYQDQRVQSAIASHPDWAAAAEQDVPGFAAKLQPLLAAAQTAAGAPATAVSHTLPDGSVSVKPVVDQGKHAIGTAMGLDPATANLAASPGAYTEQEFLQHAQGLTFGQAQKLMGLQHVLSPKDQITMQYAGTLDQQVNDATATLQKLQAQSNAPKAEHDKAQATLDAAYAARVAFQKKLAEGQLSYTSDGSQ